MRSFGALFSTAKSASAASTSTSTSDPSSLSVNTSILQDFVSHNWVTSRAEKFLCLAVHYNLTAATCASWGAAALGCILTVIGMLPIDEPDDAVPTCVTATVSGQVAFFVVFFGAQDFRRLLHRVGLVGQGRLLFVDKACISQVDSDLKREGIENLAGFLLASQNIVVIYGPEYLYKLWTVYELATFVMLHQDHTRITVLPTMWLRQHGAFSIGLLLAQFLYFTLVYAWRAPLAAMGAYLVGALFFCAVGGYFGRQWQRQQANITAAIQDFSIRRTDCAVESDRIQVQDNVRSFLHCLGRVSLENGEDALDEFDRIVREVLPHALVSSIGSTGIPYSHLIACTSIFMGSALDAVAVRIRTGLPLPGALAVIVFHLSGCLTLVPLAIFLAQKILARRLQLRGCADGLYIAAAVAPGLGVYFMAYMLEHLAGYERREGWAWAFCSAQLAYCGLVAIATVVVFLPRRTTDPAKRLSGFFHIDDLPPASGEADVADTLDTADTEALPAPLTPPIPQTSQWCERCGRLLTLDGREIAQL